MDNSVFFDFLRFCLDDDAPLPQSASAINWQRLYDLGHTQGIVGVLFHGLNRLKRNDPHPTPQVLAQIGTENAMIVESNKEAYADAFRVTEFVYRRYGHRSCILKGQGNALMYPDPYMRASGDIDQWIVPNDGETVEDIMRLCRRIDPNCKLQYHHAELTDDGSTPVEMHFRPSFTENFIYNARLQKFFEQEAANQVVNIVSLPDNLGRICVPTDSFNRIFQLSHVFKHFLSEGIGLRHVIDYYYLLKRGITEEEKREYAATVRRLGMEKFARGLMFILSDVLGLSPSLLPLASDKRVGKMILREVMKGGNFGKFDKRFAGMESDNPILNAFYSIVKNMRFAFEFPQYTVFAHISWILWWHFFYRYHINRIVAD